MTHDRQSYIFSSLVKSLNENGHHVFNWGLDRIDNKINCSSYKEARGIAQACIQSGYYAYTEVRYGKEYLIHVSKDVMKNKNFIPLS